MARKAYSEIEKYILTDIVAKYRDDIECKRNDFASIEKKRKAWAQVAKDFCSHADVTPRTSQQLKKCWENQKSRAKQIVREERKESMQTGGGPREKTIEMNELDVRVISLVPEQMRPLRNEFDDDAVFHGDIVNHQYGSSEQEQLISECRESPCNRIQLSNDSSSTSSRTKDCIVQIKLK